MSVSNAIKMCGVILDFKYSKPFSIRDFINGESNIHVNPRPHIWSAF